MDVHSMMAQAMKRAQPFRAAHLSICNPPAKASAEESHNKSAALPCTAAGSSFCGRKLQDQSTNWKVLATKCLYSVDPALCSTYNSVIPAASVTAMCCSRRLPVCPEGRIG